MNKQEAEDVLRNERRRQSKNAVLTVLALIGFAVFLVLLNTFVLDTDDATRAIEQRRAETATKQTP